MQGSRITQHNMQTLNLLLPIEAFQREDEEHGGHHFEPSSANIADVIRSAVRKQPSQESIKSDDSLCCDHLHREYDRYVRIKHVNGQKILGSRHRVRVLKRLAKTTTIKTTPNSNCNKTVTQNIIGNDNHCRRLTSFPPVLFPPQLGGSPAKPPVKVQRPSVPPPPDYWYDFDASCIDVCSAAEGASFFPTCNNVPITKIKDWDSTITTTGRRLPSKVNSSSKSLTTSTTSAAQSASSLAKVWVSSYRQHYNSLSRLPAIQNQHRLHQYQGSVYKVD